MAGAGSEARFAGLSLVQLNELLEDEGQLTEMVQKMEEVSRARARGGGASRRGVAGSGARGGLEVARGRGDRGASSWLRELQRGVGGFETGWGEGTALGLSVGESALRLGLEC